MLITLLGIGIGGATGAVTRYRLGRLVMGRWGRTFPLGTFLINISGAYLLCFLTALATGRLHLNPALFTALTTGFLGAYTTFSTFANETVSLLEDGEVPNALIYLLASVLTGLAAGWLGYLTGSQL
jgi:CrcB protein